MKLFATCLFALLGLLTVASALDGFDGKACSEGEKQCILNGQMIDQCIKGKWAIVKVCKPGDICVENPTPLCVLNPVQSGTVNAVQDASAVTGLDNDVAESSATEDCHDGDAQCEVLPLILHGRHAIKRCNDDHKWTTDEVCNPEDVCNADPYPHCAGKPVEARDEDTDEDTDEDALEAVSFMTSSAFSFARLLTAFRNRPTKPRCLAPNARSSAISAPTYVLLHPLPSLLPSPPCPRLLTAP